MNSMSYKVRDVFRCKPGKAKELVERFRRTFESMKELDGFRNPQIMVDAVAGYWTVVLESEIETLAQFEKHQEEFSSRPAVREAMSGYMELVEGGHREIWRIV
jgi:heme-degrading monooxygenase HmoA